MINDETTSRLYLCPNCRTPVLWDRKNLHRPFCSNRCRLIDLGAWLAEDRYIPGEPKEQLDQEEQ